METEIESYDLVFTLEKIEASLRRVAKILAGLMVAQVVLILIGIVVILLVE